MDIKIESWADLSKVGHCRELRREHKWRREAHKHRTREPTCLMSLKSTQLSFLLSLAPSKYEESWK